MTNRMGRRTAVLATSGLVSVAVVLGAGAGIAQAAPQGPVAGLHKPDVKKESTSISYERVLWFDEKDKKEHPKKEWPWHEDAAFDENDEDDLPPTRNPTASEEPGAFAGPGGSVDPTGSGEAGGLVDPTGLIASDFAPGVGDSLVDLADRADPDPAAAYGPRHDYGKKHKEISKRKDAITLERVLWFGDRNNNRPWGEWPEDGQDPRGNWPLVGDDSSGDVGGAEEVAAAAPYGPGAYEPAAYQPGGGHHDYDKYADLVKKKIRITIERVLWFNARKKHDRPEPGPWNGNPVAYLPEGTSAPSV